MTQTPLRDILNSPCNIAYLGNSITAQKNSYCEILHAYLSAQYHEVGPAIKAAIGGVGSLACNFMSDHPSSTPKRIFYSFALFDVNKIKHLA